MTRPPDFDLTTVEGIVRTVEAMMEASRHAESWPEDATEAAHHARRLQGVADAERSARWRGDRLDALQRQQRVMRDPERKMVCDILANGSTTEPPYCEQCANTGTSGERAEDGAPLVCTACQGGRRP